MNLGITESSTDSTSSHPTDMLEQLQKNMNSLSNDRIQMIRDEATAAYSNITILEDRVSALDHSHNNLAFQLNSMEQYLKEWNILIHGLQNLPVRPSDPEGRNSGLVSK